MKILGWGGWARGFGGWLVVAALGGAMAQAQVATTTVQDTVTDASGAGAAGTVVVSWQAFTTATGSSVASGSLSSTLGSGGALSVALQPNADATPMGSYYTAVFRLSDGSTSREFWVVPVTASGTVTLASIRNQVLPTTVAMQTVSKQYVDTTVAKAMAGVAPGTGLGSGVPYVLKSGDAMTGPLALAGDPVSAMQAADKHYVDAAVAGVSSGGGSPSGAAGGDLSGTYPSPAVAKVNGAALPASAAGLQTNSAGQLQVQTLSSFQSYLTAAGVAGVNAEIGASGCAFSGTGLNSVSSGSCRLGTSVPLGSAVFTTISLLPSADPGNGDVISFRSPAGETYALQGSLNNLHTGVFSAIGGWYDGMGVLAHSIYGDANPVFGVNTADQTSGAYGLSRNLFNVQGTGYTSTYNNVLDDGSGNGLVKGAWTAAGYRETLTTPASSTASCAAGQFTDDANFHYVCVAANTWKRVALAAF